MLHIDCLVLGGYQVNCYIVRRSGSDHCVVIDPGFEPETILKFLRKLELTVDAILLTHGHFDHVGAVMELMEETGCKLIMHKKDWEIRGNPFASWIFPLAGRDLKDLEFCAEGDELCLAGVTFAVLETPGHTKGTISLFFDTEEDGKVYRCGMFGGAGANTMAKKRWEFENCQEAYRASLHRLMKEKVDVFLGNHTWNNNTFYSAKRLLEEGVNDFLDPTLWCKFLEFCENRLDQVIEKEKAEG